MYKMPSTLPNLKPLRETPTQRVFGHDEINSASVKNLEVKDYSNVKESVLIYLDIGYFYSKDEAHINCLL